MPYFGLGVYKSTDGQEVINAIHWALEAGYRLIDTASFYGNEHGVGEAVNSSGIARSEIFVSSKLWNADQGYERTLQAFEETLERLNFEYLDLFLIHWPGKDKFKETWKAFEEIYKSGKVKAIGVSNFMQHHLEELMETASILPMVNQVEFHPRMKQQALVDYCKDLGIQYQGWRPLMHGEIFEVEELAAIAEKYNKTIAQVTLRWHLQKGVLTIPKSVTKERIIGNAQIFDFELSDMDIQAIDNLDTNYRTDLHPDEFLF